MQGTHAEIPDRLFCGIPGKAFGFQRKGIVSRNQLHTFFIYLNIRWELQFCVTEWFIVKLLKCIQCLTGEFEKFLIITVGAQMVTDRAVLIQFLTKVHRNFIALFSGCPEGDRTYECTAEIHKNPIVSSADLNRLDFLGDDGLWRLFEKLVIVMRLYDRISPFGIIKIGSLETYLFRWGIISFQVLRFITRDPGTGKPGMFCHAETFIGRNRDLAVFLHFQPQAMTVVTADPDTVDQSLIICVHSNNVFPGMQ